MRHWYTVAEKQDGPFKVVHSWTYDETSPRDCFDDSCFDLDDMCRKIDRGDLDWFIARVQYFYDGVEMGVHHLGGCLYDNVKQAFELGLDGYLEDLEYQAREDAMKRVDKMLKNLLRDFAETV